MSLPQVAPAVLAGAVDALPPRLRKRLDDAVARAADWVVVSGSDGWLVVTVDAETSVRLAAVVRTADDAVCGCLLAPRCLHRTAVLAAAPVLADDAAAPEVDVPSPVDDASITVDDAQLAAAAALWRAAAPLLESGIPGAGAVAQAGLLRAVHEARGAGLHRAAASGVRVVESLRAARADGPRFRLAELTDDLADLLTACHQLSVGAGDVRAALGTARREYEELGSMRLYGLFAEPILTTSGYAGAATYLCDGDARLWTVSDVRPGGLAEARRATDGAVTLGEVRLSHRDAARAGVVVVGARASAAGRLSASTSVRAVRADGCAWTDEPLAALWRRPLAEQLAQYAAALATPVPLRPAGWDLVFLRGTLGVGPDGPTLVTPEAGAVTLTAALTDPSVPAVANLRALARTAVGREALVVGRIAGARTVHALGLAADWLPDGFGGHADLTVDAVDPSDLRAPGGGSPAPSATTTDSFGAGAPAPVGAPPALQLLRMRVERAIAGGRAAVRTPSAVDVARLAAAQLPAGAATLTALHDAAVQRGRDAFGRLDPLDTDRLARAWLAAATYTAATDRHLAVAAWGVTLS